MKLTHLLLLASLTFGQSPVVPIQDMFYRSHGIVDLDNNGKYSEADRYFLSFDNNKDGYADLIYLHKIKDFKETGDTLNPYSFKINYISDGVFIDLDHDKIFDMMTREKVDNSILFNHLFGTDIKPKKIESKNFKNNIRT